MLITALVFLLILSVLVLIHELGHFFMAKKQGIKIEEFGFGLPPRAIAKKIGETLYSLNWLPIGGFVKLYGEDEAGGGSIKIKDVPDEASGKTMKVGLKEEKISVETSGVKIEEEVVEVSETIELEKQKEKPNDINRAFFSKTPWQRASVVVAGVVMNTLLAALIFYVYLGMSGFKAELPLLADYKFFWVNQKNSADIIISAVAKNSPAEKIGLKPMSKIMAVNGKKVSAPDELVKIINQNKGKNLKLSWQDVKTNQVYHASLVPRIDPPKDEGAIGISFFPLPMTTLSYDSQIQKFFSGFIHPLNLLVYNFDVMGKLIAISFQEKTAAPLGESVSGPVGVYSIVGNIVQIPDAKERVLQILNLAGLLSISLAFFNILPFPALDGGRLFFILIEATTGRKVNARYEAIAHSIGMIILLTLIALITFHDLLKIFSTNSIFQSLK